MRLDDADELLLDGVERDAVSYDEGKRALGSRASRKDATDPSSIWIRALRATEAAEEVDGDHPVELAVATCEEPADNRRSQQWV